jgi:N-acetylglucosaminyl-diphospho-decaprenol L-rhamnosyltransferase
MDGDDAPLPVYVVHWNAPVWVKSTVDSLLASSIAIAVTVVDNGPYDTPLVLDRRVRIVRSGGNRGYAGGANLGINEWIAGDDELCVVACHDVTLDRDGLERLVAAAKRFPGYGVLAPRPEQNVASAPALRRSGDITDVKWASGTCLLLRRACIADIGSFDETFGSYGEDIDLCFRARAAGWNVGVVDTPARGHGSVDPGFRKQMYVNQIRLRHKHAGFLRAAKMLIAFPLLAVRDLVRWLFKRDPALLRHARGRLRATPAGARLLWHERRTPVAQKTGRSLR